MVKTVDSTRIDDNAVECAMLYFNEKVESAVRTKQPTSAYAVYMLAVGKGCVNYMCEFETLLRRDGFGFEHEVVEHAMLQFNKDVKLSVRSKQPGRARATYTLAKERVREGTSPNSRK
jgi:hypothetical protein